MTYLVKDQVTCGGCCLTEKRQGGGPRPPLSFLLPAENTRLLSPDQPSEEHAELSLLLDGDCQSLVMNDVITQLIHVVLNNQDEESFLLSASLIRRNDSV